MENKMDIKNELAKIDQTANPAQEIQVKRNLFQRIGDWWQRRSNGEKVITGGIVTAGLAAGGYALIKALTGNSDDDDSKSDGDYFDDGSNDD